MLDDPIEVFRKLYERVSMTTGIAGTGEHDAMVLSTVDADGQPSGRYVLLKAFDQRGFVFYTNTQSRKARALAAHPRASLCFYWPAVEKQVRIEGAVERVADEEADAYFATRSRESQIGAWASDQSAVLESREQLETRVAAARERFEGRQVSRPPFWTGFRVVPAAIEFWTRSEARLHERERYERHDGLWMKQMLFP